MVAPRPSMAGALRVESIGAGRFQAMARHGRPRRVFGGQLMAQGLAAAGATVPGELAVHLVHARFLQSADPSAPVIYDVAPSTDRGGFAHRRVVVAQGGVVVFELTASFQRPEHGPRHQLPAHPGADPEDLPTFDELAQTGTDESTRRWWERLVEWVPAEVRSSVLPGRWQPGPGEEFVPRQDLWLRTYDDLRGDALTHSCAALYCSDLFLLTAAMVRHGLRHDDEGVLAVTLNHTMWFHEPFRVDEWWHYEQEGSWSGRARQLCRGQMFDRNGRLVATTMQEGLLRVDEQSVRTGERRIAS